MSTAVYGTMRAITYGYYLDDRPVAEPPLPLARLRDLMASEQAIRDSQHRKTPLWSTEIGNKLHKDGCVSLEPLLTRLLPMYWLARATQELRRHYWPSFGQAPLAKHKDVIEVLQQAHYKSKTKQARRNPWVIQTALGLISGVVGEHVCHYCRRLGPNGYEDPDGNPWHGDHFVALARGGPDVPENIVRACQRCNLRKATSDAYTFCWLVGYEPPSPPPLLGLT